MSDFELGLVFFIRDDDPLWEDELDMFQIRDSFLSMYSPITHRQSTYKAFACSVFETWSDYLTCAYFSVTSNWIAVAAISLPFADEPFRASGLPMLAGVHSRLVNPTHPFPYTLNLTRFSATLTSEITDPKLPWFEYESVTYQKCGLEFHHSDEFFAEWMLDTTNGDIPDRWKRSWFAGKIRSDVAAMRVWGCALERHHVSGWISTFDEMRDFFTVRSIGRHMGLVPIAECNVIELGQGFLTASVCRFLCRFIFGSGQWVTSWLGVYLRDKSVRGDSSYRRKAPHLKAGITGNLEDDLVEEEWVDSFLLGVDSEDDLEVDEDTVMGDTSQNEMDTSSGSEAETLT
ncbi:hypothetical protein CPB83DRAFT_838890 [Crepidotus variabilis]|uniref:Uncharacterized protein n=1 Tax=Crepidotus variabilis TaxID=179855 RepID=A0A9P6E8G3_9AGAR|nr:hypothetical protein CPB83DRAFT_838890 [Crepidotus variabilis]